jgi:hypothetical protein
MGILYHHGVLITAFNPMSESGKRQVMAEDSSKIMLMSLFHYA